MSTRRRRVRAAQKQLNQEESYKEAIKRHRRQKEAIDEMTARLAFGLSTNLGLEVWDEVEIEQLTEEQLQLLQIMPEHPGKIIMISNAWGSHDSAVQSPSLMRAIQRHEVRQATE